MNQANIEARQAMVQRKPRLPKSPSTIQCYGLAVLSVSVALGGALLLQRFHFRDVEVPLFLFAVAVAAWYGGTGAAVLALLLSCVSFDYFFAEPIYSLNVSGSSHAQRRTWKTDRWDESLISEFRFKKAASDPSFPFLRSAWLASHPKAPPRH